MKPKSTFIVELWSRIFELLGWLSLFKFIYLFPRVKNSYVFVDCWVLGHLLLSVTLLSLFRSPNLHWWEAIFLVYGGLRILEIIIYQTNVLLFDEYRKKKREENYSVRSYRRLVILLLLNYTEIVFWFALLYRNLVWAFDTKGIILNSFFQSLNLSFVTMTTFGHADISPIKWSGEALILIQSIIGVFMALLVLARFIALLPQADSMDEFEK